MTGLLCDVIDVLGSLPVSKHSLADSKWDQFLFKSEAFIRLGTLLIQKAAYYVPGEPEFRDSLIATHTLFVEAKAALRDEFDDMELKYPTPSMRIEDALNTHANQIIINDSKIKAFSEALFF